MFLTLQSTSPGISGVLTNAQGSDYNLNVSIWQYINTKVKTYYDNAALSAGINRGLAMNRDGTFAGDTNGLGIVQSEIDDPDLFKRVPCVAYCLDDGRATKLSMATGIGDGANYEWRGVKLTCVPAVKTSTDGTFDPDARALALLKTAVINAFGRSLVMPIVDSGAPPTNGLYPQIGYALIEDFQIPRRPTYRDYLIVDRRDFDCTLVLKFAVATFDGL